MAQMKQREGDALLREFETRLSKIEQLLDRAEARAPLRPKEAQERMIARPQAAARGRAGGPGAARAGDRVPRRAARLHRGVRAPAGAPLAVPEVVRRSRARGRKLNFLLQEMNREVNTLGSKGNDALIAEVVIELKDEIEKLREQVANVE
jgi:uncharacterized protein YicC (UPF0701 family)